MHTGDSPEVLWWLEASRFCASVVRLELAADVVVPGIETTARPIARLRGGLCLVVRVSIVACLEWSGRTPRSAVSMRIAECVGVRSLLRCIDMQWCVN